MRARLLFVWIARVTRRMRSRGGRTSRRRSRTLERLKGDELRDYLQDDCVNRYREKLKSITAAAYSALRVSTCDPRCSFIAG